MVAAFWLDDTWQGTEPFIYGSVTTGDFPTLRPNKRSYNFGQFAVSREVGYAGGEVKFLHSELSTRLSMTLSFESLSQSEIAVIRDHYRAQSGGVVSFALPALIWSGQSSATNLVPLGTRWKYSSPPDETHLIGGRYDVTVELVTDDAW